MKPPATPAEAQALALWKAAEADFADEKRHRAFIVYCGQTGLLQLAARLYAEREKAGPADERIKTYREMIVAQAIAAIGAPRRPEGALSFFVRHRRTLLVVFSALAFVLLLLVIRKISLVTGIIGAER